MKKSETESKVVSADVCTLVELQIIERLQMQNIHPFQMITESGEAVYGYVVVNGEWFGRIIPETEFVETGKERMT